MNLQFKGSVAAPTVSISTYGANANASSITVKWSGGSGATSFNLYRATTTSRPAGAYKTGVTSPYTDTDSSLKPGVKYYYWVEAKNSGGSAFSNCDWGNRAVTLALGSAGTVAAAGGSKSFSVTANTSWSATTSASWITLGSSSGSGSGTCSFKASANGSTSPRTGTIVVTAGSGTAYPKSVTNTVTQNGSAAALSLGASSRTFTAAAAGGKELGVSANVPWTAESSASWLVVKTKSGSGNGKIVYSVAGNPDTKSRTGKITVSGGGKTATCTITQEKNPVKLEVSPASREFTCAAAGGKELGVAANVSWTAKSSVSWIKLSKAGGSGNGKVAFSVAENPDTKARTGKITVSGGGKTATCTIRQAEKIVKLGISPAERSFGSGAQDGKEASVTANVKWTAKSSASWLKLTKSSGNGNGKVAYTLAANKTTSGRSATITVTGGGKTAKCTIRQDKMVVALSISPASRSFSQAAQSGKEASVKANVKWTAKSSASWLQLSKSSGNGNGKVAYSLKANNSGYERSATIKVTGGGKTATCTIRQAAKKSNLRFYRPRDWPAAIFVTTDERYTSTRTSFTANSTPVVCVRWAWDNNGDAVAASHKVRFAISGAASHVVTLSSSSLDTLHYRTLHRYYGQVDSSGAVYAAPAKAGTYTATITLDSWNEVPEKNESDNSASVTFTVVGGLNVRKKAAGAVASSETAVVAAEDAADGGEAADAALDDGGWVVVTTSDQVDGSVLLDGDEGTVWGPVGEGGGWIVLSYSEPIDVKNVAVKGEGLPEEGVRVLLSEDADEWVEGTEGRAQYVWVVLPEEAEGATVSEIEVEEE